MDATQIRQVVVNLLINAAEAIGPTGGLVAVSTGMLTLTAEQIQRAIVTEDVQPGPYVYVEVADTGSGMSADGLRRIFEPFFTTKFTGRGLGLSAVLGIVRGHRGTLTVDSVLGKGTRFRVLLPPSGPAADWSPPKPHTSLAIPEAVETGLTVLVVDDDPSVQRSVPRMLRRLGFEAVVAPDGPSAVSLFRNDPQRFALVLMDLTMPQMNGIETLRALRETSPDLLAVLMSGFDESEALASSNTEPLSGFLAKPFEITALGQLLSRALGRAQPAGTAGDV
jgi:CheY-like chemotaxis protein